MHSEKEVDKTAWMNSGTEDCAVRLLTVKFFKQLQGLPENITMYAMEDDKLFEWSAVHWFSLTAPALLLLFATFEDEVGHPLQIDRRALSLAEIVKLDDVEVVVLGETSPGVALCREENPSFV